MGESSTLLAGLAAAEKLQNLLHQRNGKQHFALQNACYKEWCKAGVECAALFVTQAARHKIVQHFLGVAVFIQNAVHGVCKRCVNFKPAGKLVNGSGGFNTFSHHAKAGRDMFKLFTAPQPQAYLAITRKVARACEDRKSVV